jgi:hypothetical protein
MFTITKKIVFATFAGAALFGMAQSAAHAWSKPGPMPRGPAPVRKRLPGKPRPESPGSTRKTFGIFEPPQIDGSGWGGVGPRRRGHHHHHHHHHHHGRGSLDSERGGLSDAAGGGMDTSAGGGGSQGGGQSDGDILAYADQEAYLLKEQVARERMENEALKVDTENYKRINTPTPEDIREREQRERVRRALNCPPEHEISSGVALNQVMEELFTLTTSRTGGAAVDVPQAALAYINVSPVLGGKNAGILRNGELPWPRLLNGRDFEHERGQFERLVAKAKANVGSGHNRRVVEEAMELLSCLETRIAEWRHDQPSTFETSCDYTQAVRFLDECERAIQLLDEPRAYMYVSPGFSARGKTVQELVQHMQRQGLRFAPSCPGDDWAYRAIYASIMEYAHSLNSVSSAEKLSSKS